MLINCPRWYAIKCKPRQEYRALENLERQGFCCYLFIELNDAKDDWYPIRSTRGVSHIVRFNEHPLPVKDQIIETIRQRLTSNPSKIPYLQPGERVRIVEESFSQLEAIFVANDGDRRVVLLMNILHSEQRLSFPVTSVRKCANR
jgi:transcriptional antiterminator RfaH